MTTWEILDKCIENHVRVGHKLINDHFIVFMNDLCHLNIIHY